MNLLVKIILFLIVVLLSLFLIERTTSLDFGLINKIAEHDHEENGHAENDDEKIHIVDGYKAVELENEVVIASGIKFEKITSMTFKPEFSAYAEVINIAPLVLLKTGYSNFLAQKKILQSNLYNLNQIFKRAQALHKNKSLSTRELEGNRADRDLKASELNAMTVRLQNLAYEIKSNWGDEISGLILDNDKQDIFDQLATHKASLILISFLKDQSLLSEQQAVYVSNKNQRDSALPVTYLDRANQVNNPLYGESHIYLLESGKFSSGARLFAWVEEVGKNKSGLFVPESAVVWYASKPWVYIKHEDNLFVRKPVAESMRINNGWLVEEKEFSGVLLVTEGGQTLLSEEFKWAIPDEDDD